jgi:hypothetical protein
MAREPWLDRLRLPFPTYESAHFDPELEAVYGTAIDILDRAKVPFLLAGAFALNVYTGIWRSTKDLDFFLRRSDLQAAFDAFQSEGYRVEVVDEVWLAKAWKGEGFVDLIHANANGLMPVDDTWYEHNSETEVWGRRVKVAPAEEVILSKMFVAGRDRYDGADVLHFMYALEGKLDWKRIFEKIGPHAGLLLGYLHHFRYAYPASAHFIPDEVFAECERLARERHDGVAFRGNLIDPIQFSIDVKAFGLPDERARVRREAIRGPEGPRPMEAA